MKDADSDAQVSAPFRGQLVLVWDFYLFILNAFFFLNEMRLRDASLRDAIRTKLLA